MPKARSNIRNSRMIKACMEGDISNYLLNAVTELDEANQEALKKEEKERKQRIENILEFEKQMEAESREPFDFKREVYAPLHRIEKNKAFRVTFTDHPEYLYIAFTPTREKARAEAQKYIRDTFYPAHGINDCPVTLKETRAKRISELDEYAQEKRAPIPELMKAGLHFSCCGCGKINFNYEDYATRRCFIVESDGDVVPYAKGMVFCYSCYHKYFD